MRKKLGLIMLAMFLGCGLTVNVSCSKKAVATKNETPPGASSGLSTGDGSDPLQKDTITSQRLSAAGAENTLTLISVEDIYFEFDRSTLTPAAADLLTKKAQWLQTHSGVRVLIEGHCDERGTNEYNLALGDRRAESVRAFLLNLGISPRRLDTISYGEERPLDDGHNEGAWAKNRRAHFAVK